ncbi:DNA-binding protein (plasmid) [Dyella sp. BiH032]|uniref:DNA-binding protein n=1 Tax=Dyella sp. BiH032 TaxID=3075430 RepID=UPI0028936AB8|nr:DNA-binding protein [Dyella sp. BiH032]WNL48377.1 DNA-binding protein [Dyella sp. BiH032]
MATPNDNLRTSRWDAAVAAAVTGRATDGDLVWTRLDEMRSTLQRLIDTGRCVAWYTDPRSDHGVNSVRVTTLKVEAPVPMGLGRRAIDPSKAADHAIALGGEGRTLVLTPASLTYLPGPTPARSGFQLLGGKLAMRAPFPHASGVLQFDKAQDGPSPALLLVDGEMDLPEVLRRADHLSDLGDLDGVLQAFMGGHRASAQPLHERVAQQDAIAQIRTRYVAARGPKPRPLSQADIDVIVEAALDLGQVPSLKLVHAVTNRQGSPNAVYPKITSAMARLSPARRASPPDVHKGFWEAWQSLQAAATETGQRALDGERATLDIERQALRAEKDAFVQAQAAAASAHDERERHLATLQQELRETKDTAERLQNEASGLRQALQAADALGAQDRGALAAAEQTIKELTASRQAVTEERDAARAEIATADAARVAAATALITLQERHERLAGELTTLTVELATARHQADAAAARASRAETQLADQQAAVTRLEQQRDRDVRQWGALEERLKARETECETLRPLTVQLATAQQTIARLEGEITALKSASAPKPATKTKRTRKQGDPT